MEWLTNLWNWFKSLDDKFYEFIEYIVKFAEWIVDFFVVLLFVLIDFLLGLFLKILDMLFTAIISMINLIQVPFDPSTYYNMVPADVAAIMGAIGLPQAIAMIVSSILIRLVLQLIPFVRLGS